MGSCKKCDMDLSNHIGCITIVHSTLLFFFMYFKFTNIRSLRLSCNNAAYFEVLIKLPFLSTYGYICRSGNIQIFIWIH